MDYLKDLVSVYMKAKCCIQFVASAETQEIQFNVLDSWDDGGVVLDSLTINSIDDPIPNPAPSPTPLTLLVLGLGVYALAPKRAPRMRGRKAQAAVKPEGQSRLKRRNWDLLRPQQSTWSGTAAVKSEAMAAAIARFRFSRGHRIFGNRPIQATREIPALLPASPRRARLIETLN